MALLVFGISFIAINYLTPPPLVICNCPATPIPCNCPAAVKTFTPKFYFGAAFTILGLVFAALSFLARGQMKASSPELSAV